MPLRKSERCLKKSIQPRVVFNFGASGVLQRQIEGGAPVDVFASASIKAMDELKNKGLIIRNTRLILY